MEVALIVASLTGLALTVAWFQVRQNRRVRVRVRCQPGQDPRPPRGSPPAYH